MKKKIFLWTMGVIIFRGILAILGYYGILPESIFLGENVFATGENLVRIPTDNKPNEILKDFVTMLDIILKLIYLLLRPMLAIAGQAMSNDFVYGSIFNLDVSLYKFWNIMKNISNFILGFMFVYYILRYLLTTDESYNPKNIIKQMMLAGIGIQASRWIMGALLDISTIATMGIGGFPLQVIKQDPVADTPVLGINTKFDLDDIVSTTKKGEKLTTYYTYGVGTGKVNFLPCIFENNVMVDFETPQKNIFTGITFNDTFCVVSSKLALYTSGTSMLTGLDCAIEEGNKFLKTNYKGGLTTSSLLSQGSSYVGPFYALYGSLMNMGSLGITANNKGVGGYSIEFLIKALIGLALVIPLITLAIILIWRVGYLWLVIAFSPLIVLIYTMKLSIKDKGQIDNSGGNIFDIEHILALIFQPVAIVFGISISIVFMSALLSLNNETKSTCTGGGATTQSAGTSTALLEGMGINKSKGDSTNTCYTMYGGVTELCLGKPQNDIGTSRALDSFSWIIVNILGIGLLRTVVFATMGFSKFTSGMAQKVQKMGTDFIQSTPIVPLGAGGKPVSYRGLTQGVEKGLTEISTGNVHEEVGEISNAFTDATKTKPKPETTTTTGTGTGSTSQNTGPGSTVPGGNTIDNIVKPNISSGFNPQTHANPTGFTNSNDFNQGLTQIVTQTPDQFKQSLGNNPTNETNFINNLGNFDLERIDPSLKGQKFKDKINTPQVLMWLYSQGYTDQQIEEINTKLSGPNTKKVFDTTTPEGKKVFDDFVKYFNDPKWKDNKNQLTNGDVFIGNANGVYIYFNKKENKILHTAIKGDNNGNITNLFEIALTGLNLSKEKIKNISDSLNRSGTFELKETTDPTTNTTKKEVVFTPTP